VVDVQVQVNIVESYQTFSRDLNSKFQKGVKASRGLISEY